MKRKRSAEVVDCVKSQKIYTNNQSPFDLKSLKEVKKDKNLIILNIKDKKFFYNIDGLYDYVFKFKKFMDPFTRENLTYEQLDFIRYKAYKKGMIAGFNTYKNKIIKTPVSSYSHDLSRFFYIERIVNNMKENNELYTTIQSTFEKYFLHNEKLDYFDGNYMGFPLLICKNYNYSLLTNSEFRNMSIVNRYKYNYLDPISGKPILSFRREDIINFKIQRDTDKIWMNFSIENLFLDVFDNMRCQLFNIEQLDYLCYEYNNFLNRQNYCIIDTPYKDSWKRYTYRENGKYYKYNYISRINIFLTLLDYKDNIYVENMNSYICKFWRKFYTNKKGVFEPILYIPWNINNFL
jgi:hypothetical protein